MRRAPPYSSRADLLFDAASIADPHPLYAKLRADRPLSRIGDTGVHLVASWDLVDEALGREADFSANLTGVLMRGTGGDPSVFALPETTATRVIATADEPEHKIHRAIAQPRLAASEAAKLEPLVRDWTHAALDAWHTRGGGDFIPTAELIPARVVAHVLGLPADDVSRFRKWAMMGGDILAGDVDGERLIALALETAQMAEYLGFHLDAALAEPRTDDEPPLLHALARGVEAGRIGRDEAIGIAIVMFGAGGESTAALIGSVVRRLAESPELAAAMREDEKLVPRFVEEVARLEPPFKFHYRAVRQPCQLAGFDLERGDRLMLLWASANRDEAHFENPDSLRMDRRHPKHHMSFGRGSHFCIGAPLARLEARIVCEALLARCGSITLARQTSPQYAPSIFVRRLDKLAVVAGNHA